MVETIKIKLDKTKDWIVTYTDRDKLILATLEVYELILRRKSLNRDSKSFKYLFEANAEPTELDKKGYYKVPKDLQKYIGLKPKELILIKESRGYVEVWSHDSYAISIHSDCRNFPSGQTIIRFDL